MRCRKIAKEARKHAWIDGGGGRRVEKGGEGGHPWDFGNIDRHYGLADRS